MTPFLLSTRAFMSGGCTLRRSYATQDAGRAGSLPSGREPAWCGTGTVSTSNKYQLLCFFQGEIRSQAQHKMASEYEGLSPKEHIHPRSSFSALAFGPFAGTHEKVTEVKGHFAPPWENMSIHWHKAVHRPHS